MSRERGCGAGESGDGAGCGQVGPCGSGEEDGLKPQALESSGGRLAEVWHMQLHEGHSGVCGMDWDLGRHERAGRDSSQEAPAAPRWETWRPNGVAVQAERRGSEGNLEVKEGDGAW